MELIDIIKKRRSVREFEDKEISKDMIEAIIEAANFAPSASNLQLWRFIIVEDKEIKNKLVDMGGAIFIKDVPLGILVLYDNQTNNIEYSDHVQSAAAAIQNMLLMADYIGLGACWICQLPPKKQMRRLFGVPSYYDPIAYIALGYPRRYPKPHPRENKITDIISHNRFDFAPRRRNRRYRIERMAIFIYFKLPLWFKKMTRPFVEKKFIKKFDSGV